MSSCQCLLLVLYQSPCLVSLFMVLVLVPRIAIPTCFLTKYRFDLPEMMIHRHSTIHASDDSRSVIVVSVSKEASLLSAGNRCTYSWQKHSPRRFPTRTSLSPTQTHGSTFLRPPKKDEIAPTLGVEKESLCGREIARYLVSLPGSRCLFGVLMACNPSEQVKYCLDDCL